MHGLRLGMMEDGGGEHTASGRLSLVGARERKLLAAIALATYEEASGHPTLDNDNRNAAERERCIANAQWWWLDDPRTTFGSARYFCETILDQPYDGCRAQLVAVWQAAAVLRTPLERRARPWRPLSATIRACEVLVLAVVAAAIAAGEAPIRDRICPGVPATMRAVCGAAARRRRCADCARLKRQLESRTYYHAVGARRREERNRRAG